MITLKNLTSGKELELGFTPFALESIDYGQISSSRQTYKFLGQQGSIVSAVTLETRTISIVGWVVAENFSLMKQRKGLLNGFVNPLQYIEVQENGYKIKGLPTRTVVYSTSPSDNNEVMCRFMIDLFCPDPMFYYQNDVIQDVASWIPQFHFPLIIPKDEGIIMGYRLPTLIANVNNSGHTDCGMIIEFIAQGAVKNPKLINVNTQQTISFTKDMVLGDKITINTNENNKAVYFSSSSGTVPALEILDFDSSSFLQLTPGDNIFRYDAEEGLENLNIRIIYSPKFLEVQEVMWNGYMGI